MSTTAELTDRLLGEGVGAEKARHELRARPAQEILRALRKQWGRKELMFAQRLSLLKSAQVLGLHSLIDDSTARWALLVEESCEVAFDLLDERDPLPLAALTTALLSESRTIPYRALELASLHHDRGEVRSFLR